MKPHYEENKRKKKEKTNKENEGNIPIKIK